MEGQKRKTRRQAVPAPDAWEDNRSRIRSNVRVVRSWAREALAAEVTSDGVSEVDVSSFQVVMNRVVVGASIAALGHLILLSPRPRVGNDCGVGESSDDAGQGRLEDT